MLTLEYQREHATRPLVSLGTSSELTGREHRRACWDDGGADDLDGDAGGGWSWVVGVGRCGVVFDGGSAGAWDGSSIGAGGGGNAANPT